MHTIATRNAGTNGHGRIAAIDSLGPCIYACRMADGLIKIGWSAEPGERVSRLAGVDNLLALRPGMTRADETMLHRRLTGHAAHGREWYTETPEVVAVVNEMRAEMGMPPL